jgi:hypothetical protein
MKYYITHTNQYGEKHQLDGVWDATTPKEAIAMMLQDSDSNDDGNWEAHVSNNS